MYALQVSVALDPRAPLSTPSIGCLGGGLVTFVNRYLCYIQRPRDNDAERYRLPIADLHISHIRRHELFIKSHRSSPQNQVAGNLQSDMVFRPSLQILTLAASFLSCTATFAALCYVFTIPRRSQKSLRHALVINLLVAGQPRDLRCKFFHADSELQSSSIVPTTVFRDSCLS